MKNLSIIELKEINGGTTVPTVSRDATVQTGYSIGYHIGAAIGRTVRQFKELLPFFD